MKNSYRRKGSLFNPVFFLGIALIILVIYVLYTPNVTTNKEEKLTRVKPVSIVVNNNDDEKSKIIQTLQDEVEDLKDEIAGNEKNINDLATKIEKISEQLSNNKVGVVYKQLNTIRGNQSYNNIAKNTNTCHVKNYYSSKDDIQMLHAYDVIPFDDINGGVWKQGFDIKYDTEKIKNEDILQVFVVPHSHNDPGWWYTFEGYFNIYTNNILTFATKYLNLFKDMKFIYSESSFLELWWKSHSNEDRLKMKELIKSGSLEVPTGAWVMTDEANSHLYSIVTEMIEGHEFLMNILDTKPVSHWSIDPFGLSPTVAYILKQSNITNLVIHRVHYSVKKFLAESKNLEFKWRQLWAGNDDKTDVFTHMFPFSSYDVPKTCGPDPHICCQFDFRRINSQGCNEWDTTAVPITDDNIQLKSELLADQFRKKAQLYKTNVLLIPLGDDFRYPLESEWRDVHNNYAKLMEYINSRKDLNMEVKFGTLKDYFEASKLRQKDDIITLSGDFFTYADRQDHYWSGYYTSRPFYKHMDRTVQYYVKTADIIYALWMLKHKNEFKTLDTFPGNNLYDKLVEARRHLSIFQHHDGVTGTAKTAVMQDYAEKMLEAIENCQKIISEATISMNKIDNSNNVTVNGKYFENNLPIKTNVDESILGLTLFNSLPYKREEIHCINVKKNNFYINSDESENIEQEIHPITIHNLNTSKTLNIDDQLYELCFSTVIEPFGYKSFYIKDKIQSNNLAEIYTNINDINGDIFNVNNLPENLIMNNDKVSVNINVKTGFIDSIKTENDVSTPINLNFYYYKSRSRVNGWNSSEANSVSGAYLFLPDGPAKIMLIDNSDIVYSKGKLRSKIVSKPKTTISMSHITILNKNEKFIQIKNLIDIRKTTDFELSMRLTTDIENEDFYTDLNGYQMIKRKRFMNKLPLQAHFFPNPGSAFIENDEKRLTLIGRQATGVANLNPGWLEVILDRRLEQDDDRGLNQAVTDNLVAESSFNILVESFDNNTRITDNDNAKTIGYHSILSHHSSLRLHTPLTAIHHNDVSVKSDINNNDLLLKNGIPCDLNTLSIRPITKSTTYLENKISHSIPDSSVAVVFQRFGVECSVNSDLPVGCTMMDNNNLKLDSYFNTENVQFKNASLTMMYIGDETESVELNPMELKSVKMMIK